MRWPGIISIAISVILLIIIAFALYKYITNSPISITENLEQLHESPRVAQPPQQCQTQPNAPTACNSIQYKKVLTLPKAINFNDRQNVHDFAVVKSYTGRYNRLKSLVSDPIKTAEELGISVNEYKESKIYETLAEINHEFIDKHHNDKDFDTKCSALQSVLLTISHAFTVVFLHDETTEDWIITQLWERIGQNKSEFIRTDLKEMLFTNLIDCMEEDGPVCIVGRVSRVLSTLTLLDEDDELSKPEMTIADVSNEIYGKVVKLLDSELTVNNMNELYNKLTPLTVDEQNKLNKCIDNIKKNITESITNEYRGILPTLNLENIILTCCNNIG